MRSTLVSYEKNGQEKKNDFKTFPGLVAELLILRIFRRSDAADGLVFRGDPIVQKYDDPVIHTEAEAGLFMDELHAAWVALLACQNLLKLVSSTLIELRFLPVYQITSG